MEAANRTKNVKYAIRDIAVLAKQVAKKKKVISLNVGDPNRFDFRTPPHLIAAVTKAMKQNKNYYADSAGEEEAIDAIADFYRSKGVNVLNSDILISFGVSEAIGMCIAAFFNPGDNVLIPKPSYPVYSAYLNLYGIDQKFYTLNEDANWNLDVSDIEKNINDKTKAIVVINPNNPTGGVYDKQTLKDLVNLAGQHNLVIFSDEIYDELILEGKMYHTAALSKEVPVITFNGLAKNFLAPGWRTGWAAIKDVSGEIKSARDALFQLARARLCASTPQQYAIKSALQGNRKHVKDAVKKLKTRRDITFKRINEINGLSLAKPSAAFYAFPRINFGIDDKSFCTRLLEEEGVATVYGSGFDMPGHFRIVYLPKEDILNEALDKIESLVKRVKQ
ncbi:MAG: aminotransferase class I/II-fold pyridoxal phosphate-dependent enzyme [Candidatus Aenigmarchaeota archaeon]|nr:aminotransferase class I/II-fold pyridoxal phosphate-dependent enzyme [Candidatus Aenigmarchaeota archaeon]